MAIHPGLNSRYTVDQKKGEKTMAYLKGYVDHIRFRNEDNGYTIAHLANSALMSMEMKRLSLDHFLS